ncbi:MAG: hypothetical protein M0Z62_06965 [Actinomycetota bacterium]|nr:hypothetical protein [Actinomycetota bacterium]
MGKAVAYAHPAVRLDPVWSVSPCCMGDLTKVRAAVVGDSITFFAKPAIASMLRPHAACMISGRVGWTIAEQEAAIVTDLDNPERPPIDWIVNLGTNDAIQRITHWRPAAGRHACRVRVPSTRRASIQASRPGVP